MKVSYKWLKEYIDFDYNPEELATKLTLAGLEVDGIEYLGENIKEIVVGQIKEMKEHENADKLSVCKVDIGADEELQIVCGAKNMKVGDKVPVAVLGITMPNGMEIKQVKLRGVTSCGMMCSTNELGLPDDGVDGLFILPSDVQIGNKLVEELGIEDIVIELDLTPNFAHCLSMIGVAREIAAITGNKLTYPESEVEEIAEDINDWISIEVEDEELAPRYAGRVITDVQIKESPLWLKNRLEAVGIRPINNVVDVTNFILMEFGQPLHAFDYEQIEDNQIIVRPAKNDETLITLEGEERELDKSMLVIADQNKPLCLGGVMGGANSEVTKETTTIFLESANFNPVSVRKTSKKLAIHSDSSHRFERGVDINLVDFALNRAAKLIAELSGAKVLRGVIDQYPKVYQDKVINLRPKRVCRLLGTELAKIKIKNLLERLHFTVEDLGNELAVTVPAYRVDVKEEVDLVEEVARLYGYDKIDIKKPLGEIVQGKKSWKQQVEDDTRNILAKLGLFEAQNYSFISPKALDKIKLPKDHQARRTVQLSNPLGVEYSIMRTTLIPGLLDNVALNINQKVENILLFELGKIFISQGEDQLPNEKLVLAGAIAQEDIADSWNLDAGEFFYLKGILEDYFAEIGLDKVEFVKDSHSSLHPGRTAAIKINNELIGYLGELHPDVQENYKFNSRVVIFELDFELVVEYSTKSRIYQQLPKYPALTRDIALVVKEDVASLDIKNIIQRVGLEILESVELFDLYQGEQLEEGYKSLAYSLVYRTADRTLTDQEVNQVQNKIEEELNSRLGAKIRE